MVVVSTPMTGAERGMEGSFGRLFRYITGDNQRGEKIAMTTPVLISEAPTSANELHRPEERREERRTDSRRNERGRREMQAGRFAVLRFRGSRSGTQPQTASQRLQEWVQQQNLTVRDTIKTDASRSSIEGCRGAQERTAMWAPKRRQRAYPAPTLVLYLLQVLLAVGAHWPFILAGLGELYLVGHKLKR